MVQPVITYNCILVAFNVCAIKYQYIEGIAAVLSYPLFPLNFSHYFQSIYFLPLTQQAFYVSS